MNEKEITEFVKILDKKVPLSKLRANLRKVAENRGLVGANLELNFDPTMEIGEPPPYYNIYKYAFFGMVPERELKQKPKIISSPDIGTAKLFTEKEK